MSYLVLFCSCVFSPFSIAITFLGEERANLSVFRTFVRFALVWFFSISSFSWCLGRAVLSLFDFNILLNSGRHQMLSKLASLSVSSLR